MTPTSTANESRACNMNEIISYVSLAEKSEKSAESAAFYFVVNSERQKQKANGTSAMCIILLDISNR